MADAVIKSGTKVAEYLQAAGYSIKKSAVYNHIREGKLRPDQKGGYSVAAIDRYANRWLAPGAASAPVPELTDLQEKKLAAEVRKLEAQAHHWRLKTEVSQGLYIERDQAERELAARAAVLKSDLANFVRAEAETLVALVDGDAAKAPDLIDAYLDALEGWMDRYAEDGLEWGTADEPDDDAEETDDAA